MTEPLLTRRPALASDVYELIKKMIMDNELAPDAPVNVDSLARRIGVSQTPTREALVRLESERLVRRETNRGFLVTPLLTLEQLSGIYDMRLLIEPWVAERVTAHTDPEIKRRLHDEMTTVESLGDRDQSASYEDFRTLCDHDARLHLLLAELAGNEAIVNCLTQTNAHLHSYRVHRRNRPTHMTVDEHWRIVAAVVEGDPAKAGAAMRAHLEAAKASLFHTVDCSVSGSSTSLVA